MRPQNERSLGVASASQVVHFIMEYVHYFRDYEVCSTEGSVAGVILCVAPSMHIHVHVILYIYTGEEVTGSSFLFPLTASFRM